MSKKISLIINILFLTFICDVSYSDNFSERKQFNKIINGFYKNTIYKCQYINKSWSTGFEDHPYGMVLNSTAFKDILVFEYKSLIGTLWPNIGEISTDKIFKKISIMEKNY